MGVENTSYKVLLQLPLFQGMTANELHDIVACIPFHFHKYAEKEVIAHENICKINAPIIELSATEIRKMIREKKNVRPMLPPEVFEYIDTKGFYQNSDF